MTYITPTGATQRPKAHIRAAIGVLRMRQIVPAMEHSRASNESNKSKSESPRSSLEEWQERAFLDWS